MATRFELESLAAMEHLLAALETEDVLGAVLRAQLQVEQTIEVFLAAKVTSEMKEVFKVPQHFAQKMMLAAALGLPKELCHAALALNELRNKFAHRAGWVLREADVRALVDRYESARLALDPQAYEMRTSSIRLFSRGSEKIDFGTKGPEWDFKMVSAGIVGQIVKWMARQNANDGHDLP